MAVDLEELRRGLDDLPRLQAKDLGEALTELERLRARVASLEAERDAVLESALTEEKIHQECRRQAVASDGKLRFALRGLIEALPKCGGSKHRPKCVGHAVYMCGWYKCDECLGPLFDPNYGKGKVPRWGQEHELAYASALRAALALLGEK